MPGLVHVSFFFGVCNVFKELGMLAMAARRGRLARFKLPTILESDASALDPEMEGISDGFLQCIVAVLLVLVAVCCIGLWTNNVSTGHFADLRYVDTQISVLQNQMAALQLEMESHSVVGELSAIRDVLRALTPREPTPTTVRTTTTTPPSTTAAVGAADFDGPSSTPASLIGAANYEQPAESGTTEPDFE
jgi:hypothetical protein